MDPYVYPGTNTLRNRRAIRQPETLQRFEADAVRRRSLELEAKPVNGAFDADHLRAIHKHLFQDVYSWAGQIRTVNIARAGQTLYAYTQHIDSSLRKTCAELHHERCFQGYDAETFAGRAAHLLGEINAVHPFREGNGRTQREFLRQLALRNGHHIQWGRVSRDEMYVASHRSFQHGDNALLTTVMRKALIVGEHRGQTLPDRQERRKEFFRQRGQQRSRDRDQGPEHEY